MAHATRATTMLEGAGVPFAVLSYTYDPDAERIGLQAAEALGEPPARVLKTLMALADGKPVCAIVPSDAQVSMKRLAAAFGAKAAALMPAHDAERLTGYVVGGISPFGQKKRVPTAIEATVLGQPYVIVNAGRRGLQLRIAPADVVRVLQARTAALVA